MNMPTHNLNPLFTPSPPNLPLNTLRNPLRNRHTPMRPRMTTNTHANLLIPTPSTTLLTPKPQQLPNRRPHRLLSAYILHHDILD